MKHTFIALSLFTLCTQQIIFSAERYSNYNNQKEEELQPIFTTRERKTNNNNNNNNNNPLISTTKTTLSPDELVTIIDAAIDKKINATGVLGFRSSSFTEQEMFDIINTIAECGCVPNDDNLIHQLHKKNSYFEQAIKHFTDLARKNFDNVTISTLATIQNSNIQQPTSQLNQLPLYIKKYVMERAYNKMEYSYDIILSAHTDNINYFDVCATAHLVATSSHDKTLCLWDLTTGKFIHQFPGENNFAHCIDFNLDGSRLITATRVQNNESWIKLWDTRLAKKLADVNISGHINQLSYGNNNILATFPKADPRQITIYSTDKDSIKYLAKLRSPYNGSSTQCTFTNWHNLYKARNPNHPSGLEKPLTITKENCRSLYLCMQAVKNIKTNSHPDIKQLPLFKALTEYEQKKVLEEETQRVLCIMISPAFDKWIEKYENTQTNK